MKSGYLPPLAAALLLVMHGAALAHGDEDHGAAPTPAPTVTAAPLAIPQRQADGSLFIPKAIQRQWGLRTVKTDIRDLPLSVELSGKVVADATAGGRVQSTQPGRIVAPAQGLPTLGQQVRKGQVLAHVQPTVSGTERGGLQAQLADLDAQQTIAKRKAERYDQLQGAVPQSAIDAAQLEWVALRQRRQALQASLHTPELLRAPVSGVVSAVHVMAGQVVDARETLFEVVNPARLTVEALAYDPALTQGVTAASTHVAGRSTELQFVGSGRQLREQAWVLQFRIPSDQHALAVGQSVKVIATTRQTHKGAAVPQAAVVRGGGGDQAVWVHTTAEKFERRTVRAQALSADSTALISGIAAGERVVTQGASLLAQVR
ncbi:MAG: efflux RND transporter periplasmic adaptor subunit [Giesbergeria sp.]